MGENLTEKLSPRQLKALEALLTTGDKTKAARAAKIARPTLYKWLQDPTFQAALEAATREALREFSQNLVRLAAKATQALDAALSADQEIGVRLRAADIVTGRLLQVRELIDIEERLAKLEQQAQEGGGYA